MSSKIPNVDNINKEICHTYNFSECFNTNWNLLQFWYFLDLVGEILSFQ